jgi:microsomal dipeptidase-like Zn-dependent dipeptidase
MTEVPYTAYSYLGADEIARFELAPEFGRVPPYGADLTAAQAGRASALLRDSLVISLHDHPVRFPVRMEQTPEYNRTGRQHAAYAGLAASGMTVVFDNMMDGTACVTGNAPWRWNDIITDLGMRQADLAHADGFMTIRTVADIDEAHRSGRVGLVFGLEAATPVENEIDRLDVLYGLGLRQIGIAYSDANALGSGLSEAADGGGVIGMSAAPHTTLSAAHPRHSIGSVMDHFRYCADLVGIDHVAFGPDTLYGDHVALHRIFAHLLSLSAMRGPRFDPVSYVDGLENPTENFGNICGWLVQQGFDDASIRAVIGGNVYRTLQAVWR